MLRYFLVLWIIFACTTNCRRNLFQSLEDPLSVEETATLMLERKDYNGALTTILAELPLEDRQRLLSGSLSPLDAKQLLLKHYGQRPNREAIFGIYGIALIGASGIDALQLTLLVSQLSEGGKQPGISDILKLVLSNIPRTDSARLAIDTVILVGEITDDGRKSVSRLSNDILIYLLAISARLLALDTNTDSSISTAELSKLDPADAQAIYDFLQGLRSKVAVIRSKSEDESYHKLAKRLDEFQAELEASPGLNTAARLKNYLAESLSSAGGESFSIDTVADVYIFRPTATLITPKAQILSANLRDQLAAKREAYLELVKPDDAGWVVDTKCDGLLFNALYALGGGKPNILAARTANGQWFRHHRKDCFANAQSKSTISRDMLVGLLLWIWRTRQTEAIASLVSYGKRHTDDAARWVMGEGESSRIGVDLALQEVFHLLHARLSGQQAPALSEKIWVPNHGFEAHIDMLLLILRAELIGGIVADELELIRVHAQANPRNALYRYLLALYTDGQMDAAANILLTTALFPAAQLPGATHRCTFYLWQRSEVKDGQPNPDWSPCTGDATVYSGIDFLFVAGQLLR